MSRILVYFGTESPTADRISPADVSITKKLTYIRIAKNLADIKRAKKLSEDRSGKNPADVRGTKNLSGVKGGKNCPMTGVQKIRPISEAHRPIS